ncbi:glycosyltransferase [Thermodesulfobacteriota bacterium]
MELSRDKQPDPLKSRYQHGRIAHWDRVSVGKEDTTHPSAFYHSLLHRYYKFLIPPGLRIIELGCGHGDLLAALQPSFGVGVDFSDEMIRRASKNYPGLNFIQADAHEIPLKGCFDVIILSDLVNDLWDVQTVLENLRQFCHGRTRLILNFYNNLWRIPFSVVKKLGLGHDVLEQNWFAPQDVFNLLGLTGYEVIKYFSGLLIPLKIPLLSGLANRYLAHVIPFKWFALTNFVVARPLPAQNVPSSAPSVSVIIPARNEAGNIENIFKRLPKLGGDTEMLFVEGHSRDHTYEIIEQMMRRFPDKKCRLFRQTGKGKGDAVRMGFEKAAGDVLMILDADMTVPPRELSRFLTALISGKGEFINGVRLVYPMQDQSMRFLNMVGNKFFSLLFTWLLGQPIKDTLCGTKVLWKHDYELIAENRNYFGEFDPFGDFDLLFGAAKLNLKITEVPIRYRSRAYGETNIDRWQHGWLLLKMAFLAARRIKFI